MKKMILTMGTTLAMAAPWMAWGGETPQPTPRARVAPRVWAAPGVAMAMEAEGGSYLGVDVKDVSAATMKELKLKEERGVEITMVDQDAPAGKAGLKEHDVILDFNGQRVEGMEQLRRMIRETPPGRVVALGISRDGQPAQIKATLAARQSFAKMTLPRIEMPEMPDMPDMPNVDVLVRTYSSSAGMMIDNLTPQLGEFLGVKGGEGVLVKSVEKGSAAEAAGLKAGDVIVKLDNERITDRSDWRRAVRNKSGKVNLGIIRDKREQSLPLALPTRRSPKESSWQGNREELEDGESGLDSDVTDLSESLTRALESARPVISSALRTNPLFQRGRLKNQLEHLRSWFNELPLYSDRL